MRNISHIISVPISDPDILQIFHKKSVSRSSRPEVFCKKGVLRNFAKITVKHPCQSLFFNKVAGLRTANLLKERLWHKCFTVNVLKFLKTPFYIEHHCFCQTETAISLATKHEKTIMVCSYLNFYQNSLHFITFGPEILKMKNESIHLNSWHHSHKKQKDSLETQVVFVGIFA